MEEESKIILYTTPDGKSRVSLMSRDGCAWLNQKQMAELLAVSKMNISLHVSNILKEKELDDSVVKCYFTTAADGKKYKVIYYALEMILAVGFRVRGVRGTQFRQWANAHLSEYLVKGFTMDDERLKNPDGRPDYFDEHLARIRDIRASEKRFYQKVRDLFALSSDYHGNELAVNRFFAEVQNKLLFAAGDDGGIHLAGAKGWCSVWRDGDHLRIQFGIDMPDVLEHRSEFDFPSVASTLQHWAALFARRAVFGRPPEAWPH